ncbi:conserved oligomeric golgi complex subunit 8 [Moniliophthora roreri MCA 2997]|uniref:Conserved oligomeric Golgi complex subunit 8 n=2 Tax=Moniliophthora roreri TaxID=221103 RepID=V2XLQ1_MONRO|nr:conserved oligomeric golgi complex subunit 8 [Moniliophthora roreri MCA 2997]KAI3622574.1 conserved oligomeric golgi complex subunit 8 [Moniliophthora roreri]
MAETVTSRDHVPEDAEGTGITLAELFSSSVTTPASQEYLNHLTTLPLSTLLSEPTALQTQSHHLTSSLTSLTHTSYPTFISLHTTTTALTSSLQEFSSSLDALVNESLPALEESSVSWREHTDNVLSERRKARVVLEQHDKIRDLLDIPLLIDTCVRNGYFSEALSLAAHAKSISSSYSASGKTPPLVLTSVMSEVQNSTDHMLLAMLTTLHEPNRKLPALWKAVNFIRKMDAFHHTSDDVSDDYTVHPEEQIALAFLAGREQCLNAALDGCKRDIMRLVGAGALQEKDRSDLAEHLRRYIDLWRKEVSDIVAQYTSIFLEHLASDSAKKPSTPNASSTLLWRIQNLITTYALHNLETHLIPLLSPKLTLSHIPLSLMQSILKPLTFCCNSFARIGMDFRGILNNLFSDAIFTIVTDELGKHTQNWVDKLTEKTGSRTSAPGPKRLSVITPGSGNKPTPNPMVLPSKWLMGQTVTSPPSIPKPTAEQPAHVPPPILTTYPPLAIHTNAILTTFNNLRLIAPTAILSDLQSALDKEIARCGQALMAYIKCVFDDPVLKAQAANGHIPEGESVDGVEKGLGKEERFALTAGKTFFGVWVPFVRRALGQGVYGIQRNYDPSRTPGAGNENGVANGNAHAHEGSEQGREGAHELAKMMREWESWLEDVKR